MHLVGQLLKIYIYIKERERVCKDHHLHTFNASIFKNTYGVISTRCMHVYITNVCLTDNNAHTGKGKVHPKTCHEGPKGE
jgi:hypothetical protein